MVSKPEPSIQYEGKAYEKAPTDDINTSTTQGGALSSDEQKLARLEGTISSLQEEINTIMKMHTDEGKQGLHDWQSEDKNEGGAKYSMVHLLVVFVASMGLGAFLI